MLFFVVVLLSTFLSLNSLAESGTTKPEAGYETVITDASFSSSSRFVIEQAQIKESRAPNLVSLLASQANIAISSTAFLPNSIYFRGGDPGHVLFLVDGVPYYDASTSQRTINLNTISLQSIRKIEVIRGSQSVLYGGQALTGVIKIETFPSQLKTKTTGQVQAGSNNLQQISGGHLQNFSGSEAVSVGASAYSKNNKSPVDGSDSRYGSKINTGELAYLHREDSEWIFKINGSTINQDLSGNDPTGQSYAAVDTIDLKEATSVLGATAIYRQQLAPWSPRLSLGFINADRAYTQPINSVNSTNTRDNYSSQSINTRLDLNPLLSEHLRLDVGLNSNFESMVYRQLGAEKSNTYQESYGSFAKADWFATHDLTLSLGSRYDLTQKIYYTNTAQFGANWRDRIKLEIASGFKNPAISQLYGNSYTNPNLKPERSQSYSLTGEAPINDRHGISMTVFEVDFNDLITFVSTGGPNGTYINLSRSQTRGVEFAYSGHPVQQTDIQVSLGYQEPYDVSNARWLSRRPLQSGSAKWIQRFTNQTASLEVFGNGEKLDSQSYAKTTSLPSYIVWNGSYSYQMPIHNCSLFTRVNNLFDKKYSDAYGYTNEGLSASLGLEWLD